MSSTAISKTRSALSRLKWALRWRIMQIFWRISSRIGLWKFRRLINLRNLVLWCAEMRIRCLHGEAKQEGADKNLDKIIAIAARKFLLISHFDDPTPDFVAAHPKDAERARDLLSEYASHKVEVDDLVSLVSDDEALRNARQAFFVLEAITGDQTGQADRKAYYAKRAEVDEEQICLPEPKTIEDDIKIYKNWYKAMDDHLADADAIKLRFSVDDATKWIALSYAVLLVGAYFRAHLLYGAFGIPITAYFGVTDYLAAGVDAIGSAALASALGLAMLFAGFHHGSRKSPVLIEYESHKKNYFRWFLAIIIATTLIGSISDRILFHWFIQISGTLLILIISMYLSKKYFVSHILPFFVMYFVAIFTLQIWVGAMNQIAAIREVPTDDNRCLQYKFKTGSGLDPCNAVLIGTSADYMFFYESGLRKGLAVPRHSVELGTHSLGSGDIYEQLKPARQWLIDLMKDWLDAPPAAPTDVPSREERG